MSVELKNYNNSENVVNKMKKKSEFQILSNYFDILPPEVSTIIWKKVFDDVLLVIDTPQNSLIPLSNLRIQATGFRTEMSPNKYNKENIDTFLKNTEIHTLINLKRHFKNNTRLFVICRLNFSFNTSENDESHDSLLLPSNATSNIMSPTRHIITRKSHINDYISYYVNRLKKELEKFVKDHEVTDVTAVGFTLSIFLNRGVINSLIF